MKNESTARKGGFQRERRAAKDMATTDGITLMQAQDAIARGRGFSHWSDMLARGPGRGRVGDVATEADRGTVGIGRFDLLSPPFLPDVGPERDRHLLAVGSLLCGSMIVDGTDRRVAVVLECVMHLRLSALPEGSYPGIDDIEADLNERLDATADPTKATKGEDMVSSFLSALRRDVTEAGRPDRADALVAPGVAPGVRDLLSLRPVRLSRPDAMVLHSDMDPRALWRDGLSSAAKCGIVHRRLASTTASDVDLRLLGRMLAARNPDGSPADGRSLARAAAFFPDPLSGEISETARVSLDSVDVAGLSSALLSSAEPGGGFLEELFPGASTMRRGDGCDVLFVEWIADACTKMDAGRKPFRYDPIGDGYMQPDETKAAVSTLVRARGADEAAVRAIVDLIHVVRSAATRGIDLSEIAGSVYEEVGRRIVLPVLASIVTSHLEDPEQVAFYARLNRLKHGDGRSIEPCVDGHSWRCAAKALAFLDRPALAAALG